ncbi:MAG: hypothetical protein ACQESE_05020 [Nanobdellota archaeon]
MTAKNHSEKLRDEQTKNSTVSQAYTPSEAKEIIKLARRSWLANEQDKWDLKIKGTLEPLVENIEEINTEIRSLTKQKNEKSEVYNSEKEKYETNRDKRLHYLEKSSHDKLSSNINGPIDYDNLIRIIEEAGISRDFADEIISEKRYKENPVRKFFKDNVSAFILYTAGTYTFTSLAKYGIQESGLDNIQGAIDYIQNNLQQGAYSTLDQTLSSIKSPAMIAGVEMMTGKMIELKNTSPNKTFKTLPGAYIGSVVGTIGGFLTNINS